MAIHFIGRSRPDEGGPTPRWIRPLPPVHGESATHRPTGSDWDPPLDPGFPIVLVSGLSPALRVSLSLLLRRLAREGAHPHVRAIQGGEIRFAQSPSGGGEGNPAWDFVFLKRGYQVGEMFHVRMRAVYRDFRGIEDIVHTYEAWSGERVELPRSER